MIDRKLAIAMARGGLLVLALCITAGQVAAQPAEEADDHSPPVTELEGVAVETLVSGLEFPVSVVIRPASTNSGPDLFIADRGSGKIVAVDSRQGGDVVDVVTGFAAAKPAGDQPTANALLGLLFLKRSMLLAVTDGTNQEEQLVAHYDLKDEEWPLAAEGTATTSKLTLQSGQNPAAELRSAGIARNVGDVLMTSPSGQLFRAAIQGSELKPFSQFGDLAESTSSTRPGGITFSDKGYLVVALAGAADKAGDSVIAFCHPYEENTKPLLVVETGLDDIVALAYSPKTGNLYAADYSQREPSSGGVYRIDAHRDEETKKMGAKAVLVAKIEHPTSLVFAGEGSLLVASIPQNKDESEATGVVLKLTGEL